MLQVDVGQWGVMKTSESKQGMANLVMEEWLSGNKCNLQHGCLNQCDVLNLHQSLC